MGISNSRKIQSEKIGAIIRQTRRNLGYTQRNVAEAAGTGLRFIIELEQGKPTCQLSKSLDVLNILGIRLTLNPPAQAVISDAS